MYGEFQEERDGLTKTIILLCQSPSTLEEEKQYNPFLRSHTQDLHQALGLQQSQDEDWTLYRARVLEELRRRKDIYKGQ